MGVYQIQVVKRAQRHEWRNGYIVVAPEPFTREELERIADLAALPLWEFERQFYCEEVTLVGTETTPICDPPEAWIAFRPMHRIGNTWRTSSGLQPFAIEDSTGPSITLALSLQPIANRWGWRNYRYALHRDDVRGSTAGLILRPESQQILQKRLEQAKQSIQHLLKADTTQPVLVVSASRQPHLIETYQLRRLQSITLQGVHLHKHRR